jgi:excisionase family DNA binding protein
MARYALSVREAAREYGLDRRLIADAIRAGSLPAARLGRRKLTILRADLEDFIRGHAVQLLEPQAPERGGAGSRT